MQMIYPVTVFEDGICTNENISSFPFDGSIESVMIKGERTTSFGDMDIYASNF